MSPLLTGLAKLTREELDALMVEHERLKRHEREKVLSELEQCIRANAYDLTETDENGYVDDIFAVVNTSALAGLLASLREEP